MFYVLAMLAITNGHATGATYAVYNHIMTVCVLNTYTAVHSDVIMLPT